LDGKICRILRRLHRTQISFKFRLIAHRSVSKIKSKVGRKMQLHKNKQHQLEENVHMRLVLPPAGVHPQPPSSPRTPRSLEDPDDVKLLHLFFRIRLIRQSECTRNAPRNAAVIHVESAAGHVGRRLGRASHFSDGETHSPRTESRSSLTSSWDPSAFWARLAARRRKSAALPPFHACGFRSQQQKPRSAREVRKVRSKLGGDNTFRPEF
jgi:hypothetical protein